MINYADYEFYANEYKGKLDATLFNSLLTEASLIVKNNINKQLIENKIPYEVKWVTCAMIEALNEENERGNVSSISIDGVSKTYSNANFEEKKKKILEYLPHELTSYL